jgi:UDP-N-acetyl-D-mannosaminuronate dehydrogenase
MNCLVVGMGEIGSAVTTVLSLAGNEVSTLDINSEHINKKIDVMCVCFPYSDTFVEQVQKYAFMYSPKLIVIHSTVKIGTTRQIAHAVHIPIEGKHPRLDFGVRKFKKFIGYNTTRDRRLAIQLWKGISNYATLENSDWTEFLKLASTSKYGLNIVWADYMAHVAESLGMPYDRVKEWDKAYNRLYKEMHLPDYQKFVLDAPDGYIGGHCIVPNAKLLITQFPDAMLEAIIEMGDPNDSI